MLRRPATLVSLLSISAVFAVARADSGSHGWVTRAWKSDDGLPNNQVTGLAQTPDGYLWVSTFSRPARFDGLQFEDYFLRDFGVGANQKITALELRSGGGVWLGTSHGQVISVASNGVRVFTNGLPDLVTQSLLEDASGAIWATYLGGGVYRIKEGQVTSFGATEGMPAAGGRETQVCALARDRDGRIWFAKNGRLGRFRDGHFETLLELPSATARVAPASRGGIWIFCAGKLMRFSEGIPAQTFSAIHAPPAHAEPTALLEDRSGGVWVGTAQHGLYHFTGSDFEIVPVSDINITSLREDREGNLWVGTGSSGLNRVRPRVVELETTENGMEEGTLVSLCEDRRGTLWATTQNGLLLQRTNGHWQTMSTNAGWPAVRATCVTMDATGAVWIGTKDRALYRWEKGRFERLSRGEGLAGREIHSLLARANGELWIGEGTPDIVQRYKDGQFDNYALPPNVRVIRAMTEDASGNLWLGTSKGVLLRISQGVVTDETARTTGEPLSIRYLYATPDGGVWIGYADDGAGWIRNGSFFHFTPDGGFPEENVSQIIADGHGWIWFGGDHGIFKAQQRDLEAFAAGKATRVNEIRFGQSEGLSGLEANCGASPGSLRGSDGRLWVPMRNALAVIDPGRFRDDPNPPPVVLKRVSVDDRAIAAFGGSAPVGDLIDLQNAAAALRLPPGHHHLEFQFAALSLSAPENVRFRYRLEGFDERWAESGERSASYSRLAAGHYRFSVIACNSDGVWNETGAALAFTVAPFVWQTWWFRLAAFVLFSSAIAAAVRYISFRRLRLRLEGLERQAALDKERARIARDIHDDLGSRLTEVELMIELTHRAPPDKVADNIDQISTTVRKVGESLDEIVWAINPRHDTLSHLVDYIGQYAIQFLQTANIRCRVDIPDEIPAQAVPPEVRHNLFLAIKEALNNVARHSHATEIWLRVSLSRNALVIIIEDDGRGFQGSPADPGADGLRNMHQRMNEIGGRFEIETRPNAGTRISLALPWPPAASGFPSNGH
jgi:signal transduction histidine kinase/ligand-binding sensor domain-containing protein